MASVPLGQALPIVLREHPQDPVITKLLTDDAEFQLTLDGRPIRIPTGRNTGPEFGGELVNPDTLPARLGPVGTTGWRWRARQTAFAVLDFDATDHDDGQDDTTLSTVVEAARRAGWLWARRSKGGRGIHIIAPCQPMPAETGAQHTANVRAIIERLSADAEYNFRDAMCSAQVGYFWAPGDLAPNAFKLLVEPTREPPVIEAQAAPESANDKAEFLPQHRRDIEMMRTAGYAASVADGRLLGHSRGFLILGRPGYDTTSPGRRPSDPNLFAIPCDDGGWVLTRFGVGPEKEDPCWYANTMGYASTRIAPPDDDLLEMSPLPEQAEQAEPEEDMFNVLTCADLDTGDYALDYLIDGVLVAGQPCILAGSKKCLKTSLLVAMSLSLASGQPFLGQMKVKRACRILMLSGESGMQTLQATARNICESMGLELAKVDGLLWSEFVPKMNDKKHLTALTDTLRRKNCELLIVDPAYLTMPGTDAANLFAQGALLREIADACRRAGVGLILAHHTRKRGKAEAYEPPELDDMSWAGFAEFARQWLLVSRREPYEPGTGVHKLWLSIGGSAGHSSMWALDIDEGTPGDRKWITSLTSPAESREAEKADTIRQRIIDAAREYPQGETKSNILMTAKLRRDAVVANVFETLLEEEILVPCKVKKCGRQYDGFALRSVQDGDPGPISAAG